MTYCCKYVCDIIVLRNIHVIMFKIALLSGFLPVKVVKLDYKSAM